MMRMTGAVLSEMDEAWAQRRWFGEPSIGRAVQGAAVNAPAPSCSGTAAEHAARIIQLVLADSPIPGMRVA